MPHTRTLLIVLMGLSAMACSRHDTNEVKQDLNSAGRSVTEEAHKIGHDPAVKQAGADLHHAANDTGVAIKETAAKVADETKRAADDASANAHKAVDDAKDKNRDSN